MIRFRTLLVALVLPTLTATVLPPADAHAAPTARVTTTDPRNDQVHGAQWDKRPKGREESDLLRVTSRVTEAGLVLVFTLADVQRYSPRVYGAIGVNYGDDDLTLDWGLGSGVRGHLFRGREVICEDGVRAERHPSRDQFVLRIARRCYDGRIPRRGFFVEVTTLDRNYDDIGYDTAYLR